MAKTLMNIDIRVLDLDIAKEMAEFIAEVGRYVAPGICNECRDDCDKAVLSTCNGWRARRLMEKFATTKDMELYQCYDCGLPFSGDYVQTPGTNCPRCNGRILPKRVEG